MKENNKNQTNVPNLRFPGFEGEWVKKKLGEIAQFSKGKGISKAEIDKNGKTECIRYGELYTTYNEIIDTVISKTNTEVNNLVFSEENDIIIPASGEAQIDIATASCVMKSGVALGGDLNIIKTPCNGIFLSYYLNSKKKTEIANLAQGISVVHLYSSQLATLEISYPSSREQKKIADFLSLCEARIQCQNKIINQLETEIRIIRERLFKQQIRFKDKDGGEFPNWEVKKLGEVCEIIMGQSPNSTSYNTEEIGIPLIQGNADILNRQTKPKNWTTEITKICEIGDLILTVRAPVGAVAKSIHRGCIGRGVCAIRSNSDNSNEFVYQFLVNYENMWTKLEQGSTFTAVSGIEIRKLSIPSPSLKEQIHIANFLSSLDEKLKIEKQILEQYKKQKSHLLQNLFI